VKAIAANSITHKAILTSVASAFATTLLLSNLPCPAQGSSDKAVFQEESELLNANQQQQQQLTQEKQQYEQQVQSEEQQDEPYRLYAEKRVQELTKLRAAGGSPVRKLADETNNQLYALQKWLAADAQAKLEEQQHVQQIDQAIANLQNEQSDTLKNMQSDIQGLREDRTQTIEDKRFQQQMQINQFNEEQSEMGWMSLQGRPRDMYGWGYYNSPFANRWIGR